MPLDISRKNMARMKKHSGRQLTSEWWTGEERERNIQMPGKIVDSRCSTFFADAERDTHLKDKKNSLFLAVRLGKA
jgi:hypothetical protein